LVAAFFERALRVLKKPGKPIKSFRTLPKDGMSERSLWSLAAIPAIIRKELRRGSAGILHFLGWHIRIPQQAGASHVLDGTLLRDARRILTNGRISVCTVSSPCANDTRISSQCARTARRLSGQNGKRGYYRFNSRNRFKRLLRLRRIRLRQSSCRISEACPPFACDRRRRRRQLWARPGLFARCRLRWGSRRIIHRTIKHSYIVPI